MIGLDTNVVVRYLAQDDPGQAAAANRLIETGLSAGNRGFISLVVLAEVVWVMTSLYGATRPRVVAILENLLAVDQLQIERADTVWQAIRSYASSKADFSDALIAALAKGEGCETTVTFDRRAAREPGFRLLA